MAHILLPQSDMKGMGATLLAVFALAGCDSDEGGIKTPSADSGPIQVDASVIVPEGMDFQFSLTGTGGDVPSNARLGNGYRSGDNFVVTSECMTGDEQVFDPLIPLTINVSATTAFDQSETWQGPDPVPQNTLDFVEAHVATDTKQGFYEHEWREGGIFGLIDYERNMLVPNCGDQFIEGIAAVRTNTLVVEILFPSKEASDEFSYSPSRTVRQDEEIDLNAVSEQLRILEGQLSIHVLTSSFSSAYQEILVSSECHTANLQACVKTWDALNLVSQQLPALPSLQTVMDGASPWKPLYLLTRDYPTL